MKRLNLKKQLKSESDRFVPDPFDKIAVAIDAEKLSTAKENGNSRRNAARTTRKKLGVGLGASFAAAVLCLAIVLPVTLGGGSETLPPLSVRLSAENSYGIGAVTTVKLLSENVFDARTASAFSVSYDASAIAAKAQAKTFNRYFSALDSFLGDGIVTTSTIANTDENYPFETKMTIGGMDIDGSAVTYTMYYTETIVKQSDEKEKKKSKYALEGIMVMDGADYFLEGERTEETAHDESESELEIRAYADRTDKTSYIEMKQEISAETEHGESEYETEYVFSVYSDGERIEETAVKFETEQKNGKEQTKIELEFRNGDAEGKYEIKHSVKGDVSEMEVEYEIDGEEGEFYIRELSGGQSGKYEYRFSDNETIVL